jgi:hypothetical protein
LVPCATAQIDYGPGELIHSLKVIAAKEETSCSALVEELAREIVKTRAG